MKASRVLEELDAAGGSAAHIADVVRGIAALPSAERNGEAARVAFETITPVSVDVAIMERSDRVAVIPAPLEWSDVGSLLALEHVTEPDENGVIRMGRGVDIDSHDSIVFSTDRLVATLGVSDLIVVDTADATLVLPKDRVQDVRLVVDALKALSAPEVTQPKVSLRPWGSWTSLLHNPSYQIKFVEVKPGSRLSLHTHHHRAEHWVVVSGNAVVTRNDEKLVVHENEGIFLPVGAAHRVENRGEVPLHIIEVEVGDYLGEDDIVRLEDE